MHYNICWQQHVKPLKSKTMSARIIFFNLCLAILFASQAKAQIIVSDGTKIQNDTIGEAQILVQYETRCISTVSYTHLTLPTT